MAAAKRGQSGSRSKRGGKARDAAGVLVLQPVSVVARWLDVSERQVFEYARAGTIPRAKPGRYDLEACVRAYCAHVREMAAGRSSGDGKVNLVAERARLAKEQADNQALKNAILREELAPADELEEAHLAVHSAIQQRLLGVRKKLAPLVAVENDVRVCEQIIGDHIDEALQAQADLELEASNPNHEPSD